MVALEASPSSEGPGPIDPSLAVATLADPDLEAALRHEGFARIPVLDAAAAASLRAAYRRSCPADDGGLAIDYMREDRSHMRRVRDLVAPILEPVIEAHFVDHELAFVTFVTKHPGEASEMFLHEDRTFVDERCTRAGTLWIPLVDVGPDLPNGGLGLVPGSHRLATSLSGTDTPELYRGFEPDLRRALVSPALPAGTGVYYDTRTLHASPPNLGAEPREAIACAIVPRGAGLVHVVARGRRRRELYAVDGSFFTDHHPHSVGGSVPAGARLLERWDEELEAPAAEVAALLGHEPGEPAVAVHHAVQLPPEGLEPDGQPLVPAPPPPGYRARREDLLLEAADCPPIGDAPTRHVVEVLAGRTALVPLDRRVPQVRGRTGPCGADGGLVPDPAAIETDVLVVDPGSQVRWRVGPSSALRCRIDVVEAPRLGAGLWCAGQAWQAEVGDGWWAAAGADVFAWNAGPGPLVISLSMVPQRWAWGVRLAARARGVLPERRAYDLGRAAVGEAWLAEGEA